MSNLFPGPAILRSISFLLLAASALGGELPESPGRNYQHMESELSASREAATECVAHGASRGWLREMKEPRRGERLSLIQRNKPEPFFLADQPLRSKSVSFAATLKLPTLLYCKSSKPLFQLASAIPVPVNGPAWQSFERNAEKQSEKPGFNWGGALKQSGLLLGIQHSLRMLQEKTRNRLDGKWWQDYLTSIEGLQGWNDGNPIITNYVGHPMMGAITGYIQIQNDPRGVLLEWAPHDGNYWKSRMKAMFWTALYSTQYELGPLGEAMIGNVGFDRGTMGYVDLVVTPTGGLGMILLEDWLDKRVVAKLERGKSERQARFLRVVLNPQRSIANLLRFKRPSHRDTRPLALP